MQTFAIEQPPPHVADAQLATAKRIKRLRDWRARHDLR